MSEFVTVPAATFVSQYIDEKAWHDEEKAHSKIFDIVFSNNGFIAGGYLHRHILAASDERTGQRIYRNAKNSTQRCDIDCWFKSEADASRAMAYTESQVWTKSVTGFARQTMQAGRPIQFIVKKTGVPSDVIDSFDFANVKFAYDGTNFTFDPKSISYIDNGVLRIDSFDMNFFIGRLSKYLSNFSYEIADDQRGEVMKKVLAELSTGKNSISSTLLRYMNEAELGLLSGSAMKIVLNELRRRNRTNQRNTYGWY